MKDRRRIHKTGSGDAAMCSVVCYLCRHDSPAGTGAVKAALVLLLVSAVFNAVGAEQTPLYFVDAHSQVDHRVVPLETVTSLMEQAGVAHTILSARGKLKGADLLRFASKYRDRITPAVRTKGKRYAQGSRRYYQMLDAQVIAPGKAW